MLQSVYCCNPGSYGLLHCSLQGPRGVTAERIVALFTFIADVAKQQVSKIPLPLGLGNYFGIPVFKKYLL